MPYTYNRDQIMDVLAVAVSPDNTADPFVQQLCEYVKALDPRLEYKFVDLEQCSEQEAQYVGELEPSYRLASWDGPDYWGYGWAQLVMTDQGMGLELTLGGSPLQSASGVYIIPTGLRE